MQLTNLTHLSKPIWSFQAHEQALEKLLYCPGILFQCLSEDENTQSKVHRVRTRSLTYANIYNPLFHHLLIDSLSEDLIKFYQIPSTLGHLADFLAI